MFKYNEKNLIKQILVYIINTYTQHYSKNNLQATEVIIDSGYVVKVFVSVMCLSMHNDMERKVMKIKEKDLLKLIHYAIIALFIHDEEGVSDGEEEVKKT